MRVSGVGAKILDSFLALFSAIHLALGAAQSCDREISRLSMCLLRRSPFSLSGIGIGGRNKGQAKSRSTDEDDACERAVPSILTRLRPCVLLGFVVVVVAVAFCCEGCNADGRSDHNHSMRVDQWKQQCASREEAQTENPTLKICANCFTCFDASERQRRRNSKNKSKEEKMQLLPSPALDRVDFASTDTAVHAFKMTLPVGRSSFLFAFNWHKHTERDEMTKSNPAGALPLTLAQPMTIKHPVSVQLATSAVRLGGRFMSRV